MTWVRMHAFLTNWPATASPPVFEINSDTDGDVVIELAWDPQALLAPAVYLDAVRYYTTGSDFNGILTNQAGASVALSVPAQSIQLTGGAVHWAPPGNLWAAYIDEAGKRQTDPFSTTFACNLYYRVRLLPAGADQATVWPSDDILSGPGATAAPHIGILAEPEIPEVAPIPDPDAVSGTRGETTSPTVWEDAIGWCWTHLGTADEGRSALAALFNHPRFQAADIAGRADLLRLWLCAGAGARSRLPQLLDLVLPTGHAALDVTDLHGGAGLVRNLLSLMTIAPHPDLVNLGSKEHLVDDVLTELLDPNGQLDQPVGAAVSPSCLHSLLIMANPAEYARLQSGWLSSSATAAFANGESASVPVGLYQVSLDADPLGSSTFVVRTNAELAFEGAVLAYAEGSQFPALSGDPPSVNRTFQSAVRTSLSMDQAAHTLSAVFGVNFQAHQVAWPPLPDDAGWTATQASLADSFRTDLQAKPNLPLILFWTQPPGSATDISHAMIALNTDGSWINMVNPAYAASLPPTYATTGGTSDFPPRVYQDPSHRLESVSTVDLASWILGYLVPDTAIV